MKTFQEFQEAAALALPLAAPIGKAALPIIAGGIKLASDLMKADTAKPRTPNVQRGRLSSNDAYNKRMKELKRQEREEERAAARSKPASQSSSSSELGQKADQVLQDIRDAEYARQRRENPELLKKEAQTRQQRIKAERKRQRQAAMRERMNKAADNLGLD